MVSRRVYCIIYCIVTLPWITVKYFYVSSRWVSYTDIKSPQHTKLIMVIFYKILLIKIVSLNILSYLYKMSFTSDATEYRLNILSRLTEMLWRLCMLSEYFFSSRRSVIPTMLKKYIIIYLSNTFIQSNSCWQISYCLGFLIFLLSVIFIWFSKKPYTKLIMLQIFY